MSNLLQHCHPPGYIPASDKYLWLSYKPLERLMVKTMPGPSLTARRQEQALMPIVCPLLQFEVG